MSQTCIAFTLSQDLRIRRSRAAEHQGKTIQEFAQQAFYAYLEGIKDGVYSTARLQEEGLMYLCPDGEESVGLDRSVFQACRKAA